MDAHKASQFLFLFLLERSSGWLARKEPIERDGGGGTRVQVIQKVSHG